MLYSPFEPMETCCLPSIGGNWSAWAPSTTLHECLQYGTAWFIEELRRNVLRALQPGLSICHVGGTGWAWKWSARGNWWAHPWSTARSWASSAPRSAPGFHDGRGTCSICYGRHACAHLAQQYPGGKCMYRIQFRQKSCLTGFLLHNVRVCKACRLMLRSKSWAGHMSPLLLPCLSLSVSTSCTPACYVSCTACVYNVTPGQEWLAPVSCWRMQSGCVVFIDTLACHCMCICTWRTQSGAEL